jgi:hypothetical protein
VRSPEILMLQSAKRPFVFGCNGVSRTLSLSAATGHQETVAEQNCIQ